MRPGLSASIAALGLLLAGAAQAGVRITSDGTGPDGRKTQHVLYLAPDRAKIDLDTVAIIVRNDTGRIVTLMKDKHEYIEIDPKQLNARLNEAQAMLQQKLKAMPEAQRKQIEAMMAQRGTAPGAGAASEPALETTLEKTGQSRTVGAWPCQLFHQKKGADLVADLCIAPASALGLTRDDLASFRTMAEAMRKSLPDAVRRNAPISDFDAQTRQIGFEGIPIETVTYVNGRPSMTRTVKAVEHPAFAADLFDVPSGYTRKDMPGIGRPGGPGN